MARNLLPLVIVALVLSSLACGCASNGPCPVAAVGAMALDGSRQIYNGQNWDEGVVDSKADRYTRINMIMDIQDREWRDDLDMILMLDRSSSMSYWHPGVLR